MTSFDEDPRQGPPSVRARLQRWREHPLCAPLATMPERYEGPFPFDLGAIRELLALASLDAEVEAVRRALEGATDVVDVGGGTGVLARAIAEQCPVTVIEPSAEQRARLPAGLVALEGRAESLPLGDGAADAAFAAWVLPFTTDPIAAIDELERVARRRIAIVQAAPTNDLVAVYHRAAEVAGAPAAHHGWLIAHAASRLELAGFKVALESVAIPVATPPGGAMALAELLARLYFPAHPASDAIVAATGGYIAARLAEAGQLADDAVLLVARR